MTAQVEYTLRIDRDTTDNPTFAWKTGVLTETRVNLNGSTFTLRLTDPVGETVLEVAGIVANDIVTFPISLEQRTALKPGSNGRFVVIRAIADEQRKWVEGRTIITGGAQ